MKYGILIHREMHNIGDDIQTYAASCLLPHVDYVVDREELDTFATKNGEKVGVVMAAWFLWRKWNWPPSNDIVPCILGMHVAFNGLDRWGTPIKDEFMDGIGGDWLKAYAPVGCRDNHTLELCKKHGIEAYLSGCITLTLPKQPETKDRGKYICVVDVPYRVELKIKGQAKRHGLKVKVIHHNVKEDSYDMPWDARKERVEKLLTTYQNARCVVTGRLHASLPCLAMEVPVLCIKDDVDANVRFSPYNEILHCASVAQFMSGKVKYNIAEPPENSKNYLKMRAGIMDTVKDFIESTSKAKDERKMIKTKYTEGQKILWQNELMKKSLNDWLLANREHTENLKNRPVMPVVGERVRRGVRKLMGQK